MNSAADARALREFLSDYCLGQAVQQVHLGKQLDAEDSVRKLISRYLDRRCRMAEEGTLRIGKSVPALELRHLQWLSAVQSRLFDRTAS